MDGLSHALDQALLSDLECPHCLEYMVPPIKLCNNGHSICSKCSRNAYYCPICGAQPSHIRNVHLENIARRQKYPCAYRQSGCLDLFSIEHIAQHKAVCTYGRIICPINKVNKRYPWKAFKSELGVHAKATHRIDLIHTSTFISPCLNNEMSLLFCFDEVFVYSKQVRDDRLYCVVELIGPSSQASNYICEFDFHAANGVDHISKTITLRSYYEDFETSLSSGKYFRLDDVEVRNFVLEDKLNLTITLSKA